MRRRDLLGVLITMAVPLVARAQQVAKPVIGFLNGTSPEGYRRFLSAFHSGLNETGYVQDRNIEVEYRWAEGHYERLPALAADLVHRKVAFIVATSAPGNWIAMATTTDIHISFTPSSDPGEVGVVSSVREPA